MAIITISRGSYSKGKEIAEAAAERLGYDCIYRNLLLESSQQFNIPEIKLVRALHDAPSALERFTYGKEKYVAFIQNTFLKHAVKDNLVYHGLAGHFMLKGVDHCLKVRILADMADRVKLEAERENISEDKAHRILRKDDEERRRWSLELWGKDPWDPSLYDLVIHIHRITVNDAVDIICHTVALDHFKTTPESQHAVEDLYLASQLKVRLVDTYPNCMVAARDGAVFVNVTGDLADEPRIADKIRKQAELLPDVKEVRVNVAPPVI